MGALTATERGLFSTGQLAEIDKLSASRYDVLDPPDNDREAVLAKWLKKTPAQLRAMVCLGSISWGTQVAITWSPDADVTADEKQAVQDMLVQGKKFEDVFVDVVAGKRSLEQRLARLEGR